MKIRPSSALGSARLLTQIASALFMLAMANPAWAQSLPNNSTNFPMMGHVRTPRRGNPARENRISAAQSANAESAYNQDLRCDSSD
jgi:hypothetical protein